MSGNLKALAVAQHIQASTIANSQVVSKKMTSVAYNSE
jgi:hypothetical protein